MDSITESTATGTFVTEPSISHTTSAAPLPTVFTKEPEQKEVFHWEPNAASLHRGCPSWSKQVAFAFTRSPALSFDIVTCPTSWSHNSKTLNGAWPGYHVALHGYTMYHWATKCPTRRTTYYRDRLTFVSSYRQDRKVYLCPTGRTTGRSINKRCTSSLPLLQLWAIMTCQKPPISHQLYWYLSGPTFQLISILLARDTISIRPTNRYRSNGSLGSSQQSQQSKLRERTCEVEKGFFQIQTNRTGLGTKSTERPNFSAEVAEGFFPSKFEDSDCSHCYSYTSELPSPPKKQHSQRQQPRPLLWSFKKCCAQGKWFSFWAKRPWFPTPPRSRVQKGFLPGVAGCLEHSALLSNTLRDARSNQRSNCVSWLDLRNAFGNVRHSLFLFALQHDVVITSSAWCATIHDDHLAVVIDVPGNITTKPFHFALGVSQGCTLSPTLFNVVLQIALDLLEQQQSLKLCLHLFQESSIISALISLCRWRTAGHKLSRAKSAPSRHLCEVFDLDPHHGSSARQRLVWCKQTKPFPFSSQLSNICPGLIHWENQFSAKKKKTLTLLCF